MLVFNYEEVEQFTTYFNSIDRSILTFDELDVLLSGHTFYDNIKNILVIEGVKKLFFDNYRLIANVPNPLSCSNLQIKQNCLFDIIYNYLSKFTKPNDLFNIDWLNELLLDGTKTFGVSTDHKTKNYDTMEDAIVIVLNSFIITIV